MAVVILSSCWLYVAIEKVILYSCWLYVAIEKVVSARQLLLTHMMSPKVKSPASQSGSTESGQDTDSPPPSQGTGAESSQKASGAGAQGREALVSTPTKSPATRGTPEKRGESKDCSHLKGVSRKLIEKVRICKWRILCGWS